MAACLAKPGDKSNLNNHGSSRRARIFETIRSYGACTTSNTATVVWKTTGELAMTVVMMVAVTSEVWARDVTAMAKAGLPMLALAVGGYT